MTLDVIYYIETKIGLRLGLRPGDGHLPVFAHLRLALAHRGNAHAGALKRSGVRQFTLYALRHTFATRAVEAGVDLVTLAAMLGHSRVQMVMRYAHPSEEHQFNAMKKIEAHRAAKG